MKLITAFAISLVASTTFAASPASANECFGLGGNELSQCRKNQRSQAARERSTVIASSCMDGTSYHKIKTGGLLFKRTVAEGCFTDFEAAQLKVSADNANQARYQQFKNNLRNNRMRQCFGSANVYGNTVYGNSTCY